jgi:hypothetical protein
MKRNNTFFSSYFHEAHLRLSQYAKFQEQVYKDLHEIMFFYSTIKRKHYPEVKKKNSFTYV